MFLLYTGKEVKFLNNLASTITTGCLTILNNTNTDAKQGTFLVCFIELGS